MKLATYSQDGADRLGLVVDGGIVPLVDHLPTAPATMAALIADWAAWQAPVAALSGQAPTVPLASATLRAPVTRPGKILAIGLNYKDHIAESHIDTPEFQTWFAKMPSAVNGPYDPIELPSFSDSLDYEAELVIVIGKRARNVNREQAREAIFGYCVGDDVTVREWQIRVSQWVVGKSFDTHAPFGPWITTADQVDPANLDVVCTVNGDVRQSTNTRELVFDCLDQVAFLSRAMTLEPGDILFTGTSGGVGFARVPPAMLAKGDVVRVEIAGLGHIENTVVPGSDTPVLG